MIKYCASLHSRACHNFLRFSALPVALALSSPHLQAAESGFFQDSKTVLTSRTYYLSRDYVDSATNSNASGFTETLLLDSQSGFTQGPVGFGLDVLGRWTQKLDGDKTTVNTALLPVDHDGTPDDNFGRLGLAGKVRLSKTMLKVGEWSPMLPILFSDVYGRSQPQTFKGAQVTSNEIDNLTLYGGQMRATSNRDEAGMHDMRAFGAESNRFDFAGGEYKFDGNQTLVGAWYSQLNDIYHQRYYQFIHNHDLAGWMVTTNLGLYDGEEDGRAIAGDLDNRTYSVLLSAKKLSNTFYLGYQRVTGDDPWMTIATATTTAKYLANHSFNSKFESAGERSWQVRHDFDFAMSGIRGLTMMNRYISGDNVHRSNINDGREWVREAELSYTVQSSTFKNLNFTWRNSTMRRSWDKNWSFDENRLILTYPLTL